MSRFLPMTPSPEQGTSNNTTSAFPKSAWSVDVASKTCASTFPAFMRLTFSVIRSSFSPDRSLAST